MTSLFNEVGQAGTAVAQAGAKSVKTAKKVAKQVEAPPPVTHAPPPQITSSPVRPGLPAVMGQPHPTLTALAGTPTSVQDFNTRLEHVTQQSIAATGVKPKPADALAAALDPHGAMTALPPAPPTAAAVAAHPVSDDKEFVQQLRAAVRGGTYASFVTQNTDRIAELQKDPAFRATVNALVQQGQHAGGAAPTGSGESLAPLSKKQATALKYAGKGSGVIDPSLTATPPEEAASVFGTNAVGEVTLGITQVTNALVHAPAGLFEVAKAAVLDENDALHGRSSHRFIDIGKQQVQSVKQDIEHPSQRPGFLFLDILGGASTVVGAASRVAEAGRAVSAGEGATGAVKALATKAPPKSYTLSKGGYTEQTPLIDNPLVAWTQVNMPVVGLKARGARAEEGTTFGGPLGWALNQLSYGKKVGRAGDARRRVEYQAAMAPAAQVQQAAGHATAMNGFLEHIPGLNSGLTRGEQKAIQVMSWDDPNPLEAERKFNQTQIQQAQATAASMKDPDKKRFWEQVAKNHQAQLADLKLAEKALSNPTPRFKRALDQITALMAENERLRIQNLGLTPAAAAGRIAKTGAVLRDADVIAERARLSGSIDRMQGLLASHLKKTGQIDAKLSARLQQYRDQLDALPNPLEEAKANGPLDDQAFYLPTFPKEKRGRTPSTTTGFYRSTLGPFGMSPGSPLAELNNEFNGAVMRMGNYRIDMSNVAVEAYGKTIRAIAQHQDWKKTWDAAAKTPASERDVPVRDIKQIPDELRAALADEYSGYIPSDELDALPADIRKVIDWIYPKASDLTADEIPHVRWIDPDLLGQQASRAAVTGPAGRAFDKVNDLLRPAIFYIYPKYLLNKLGNDAMLIWDQGFLNAGGNLARAMQAEKLYGEANAAKMRAIVGAGRQVSYVNPATGRLNRALGEFWNKVADRDERVASFLYYARRLGYKTPEQIDALLNDEAHASQLLDASQRGKKALVEYDNLSVYERNVIRHILFVYPWVRGATVWSFRTVFEHPMKTAILAHIGEAAEDYEDKWLPQAPVWMRRIGYIPVAWSPDGNPIVVDASSINTFSTLGSIQDTVRAGTEGDPYASMGDNLGPIGQFAVSYASGRDQYGNRYPGSQFWGAAAQALNILPLLSAYERHNRTAPAEKPLKPFNIKDRSSLEARLNSALHQTVLTPAWLSGYGNILAGGFTGSEINLTAAAARYWRDATAAQKAARAKDLLNRALTIQGQYLQRPVPADVKTALNEGVDLSNAYAAFSTKMGRSPTVKEKAGLTIDYLQKQGEITPAQAKQFHGQLKTMDVRGDITAFQSALMVKHAHQGALAEWDRDVRTAASITPALVRQKVAQLRNVGVNSSSAATPQELHQYALGYVKYLNDRRKISEGKSPTKAADLRAYDDEHSGPVTLPRPSQYMVGANIPGLLKAGNIDIANRPVAHNPDGSISTVRSITVTDDQGHAYLLPTVIHGKVVSDQAAVAYWKKTGENLGYFASEKTADAYSVKLHNEQAKLYLGGGKSNLPSYTALRWATSKPQQQADEIVRASTGPWSSLNAFQKQLTGRKVPTATTEAWNEYQNLKSQATRERAATGHSLSKTDRIYLAKYVDKSLGLKGAFYKDYLFSEEPLYQRMQTLRVVTGSPNRDGWADLMHRAAYFWKAVQNKQTTASGASEAWDKYIPEMERYYRENYPAFWRQDLQPLIHAKPSFVKELIH